MRSLFCAAILVIAGAAGAAAADAAFPSRLSRAKAGEWVLMRGASGGEEELMKFSVTEVREANGVVVVRREKIGAGGEVEESSDTEINLERYAARMAGLETKAKQISRERLFVKDKELTVYAISWDNGDDGEEDDEDEGREFKMWVSEEIPVGGVAKFWCSDPEVPSAEVVDYGF